MGEMLRPGWDIVGVRGLEPLRGKPPGGHGNPASGDRGGIITDMDEAARPGKVERQSRESPRQSPKTCNLGAWPMRRADKGDGEVAKAIWGFQTQGEDRGVFTGIIP